MNLFHGALSDSFGRRPVVLAGIGVFTLASVGCALSPTTSARWCSSARCRACRRGAGIVVSRAVIRDMFPPADAQRVMSQVTIYFGVAPAVAPMVGGLLFVHAGLALDLLVPGRRRRRCCGCRATARCCPRRCTPDAAQPFNVRQPAARLLGAASAAPRFVDAGAGQRHPVQRHVPLRAVGRRCSSATHLQLAPTQFFWFFMLTDRRHHGRRLVVAGAWPAASSPSDARSATAS